MILQGIPSRTVRRSVCPSLTTLYRYLTPDGQLRTTKRDRKQDTGAPQPGLFELSN